jgi:hypothetical protein
MKTIHRYGFKPNGLVKLPQGYLIIRIAWSSKHDEASIWAIVDSNSPSVTLHLTTIPTGVEIPIGANSYMGSFETPDKLVFHVFKA